MPRICVISTLPRAKFATFPRSSYPIAQIDDRRLAKLVLKLVIKQPAPLTSHRPGERSAGNSKLPRAVL